MKLTLLISILLPFTMLHAQSVDQGNKQLYYERYQSAEHTFHQLLQQQPENGKAWYGLTRAYLQEGSNDAAADTIRMAPASVKDDPFYKAAYGYILLNENKKDSASALFNSALDQTKHKNAELLAAVARANITAKNGDANYAIDLLNKALKRDKHNPQLNVLLGDAYRKLHNGSEAYKAYQKAIGQDPKYAAAYHKMGEIFQSQKNPKFYMDYFHKAIAADPRYAPSLYQLYTYQFYHDAAKAKQLYKTYLANADTTIKNQYDLADLLYLNKEYNPAIQKAKWIMAAQYQETQPRLYKLIGYSYAGLGDTMQAITYMKTYLDKEADSNTISKDYAALATFYATTDDNDSLAMAYYEKAIDHEKDSTLLYGYFKKLADLAKANKDYAAQAKWLGRYYTGNKAANNLNLFNWGLANYRAGEYERADSVFGVYTAQYPEQGFGYYWQAKSKALLDTSMKEGLAVPAYLKLIEVLNKDTSDANYNKWIVEAYGYLAAYKANIEKDYTGAIDYFDKILAVNPENESAEKYKSILENQMASMNSKSE